MTNWSWHIYAWVVSGDLLCCLLKREGNWTTDTFFAFYVYCQVKFIHSEKATKFCEISTLDLSYVVTVKSTVEISQNFVAFSEYMNFTQELGMLVGGYLIAQAPGPNWQHSFFFEGGQINKQKSVTWLRLNK